MSELKMPSINHVSLAGRLVQDPELRITEGGVARLSARIAVNRSYRDGDGDWQDTVSFFNFVVWQKLAEYCADRLVKATPVLVTGRLRSHSWKDDDDTPHSIVEVQARSIQILERLNGAAETEAGEAVEEEEEEEEELVAA